MEYLLMQDLLSPHSTEVPSEKVDTTITKVL